MLRNKYLGRFLSAALLIFFLSPTFFAVWLTANPESLELAHSWFNTHDVLWKLGYFMAMQPAMLVFWIWLNQRFHRYIGN